MLYEVIAVTHARTPCAFASTDGASMAQMNTRIPADLKKCGDAVLAKIGYSPSAAVRALWRLAAMHESDPQVVQQLLDAASEEELRLQAERQAKLDKLHQGWQIVDRHMQRYDVSAQEDLAHASYVDLREECLMERLAEKDARSIYAS